MHWKFLAGRLPGAVALVLLLAGCGAGGGEVAIGTAGPFEEGYARMVRRAVEMAVDEINDEGGVRGTRLSVVAQDDGGDGVKAALHHDPAPFRDAATMLEEIAGAWRQARAA